MPTELAEQAAAPSRRSPALLTNLALVLFGCIYLALTRTGTHEYHHFVHGFSESVFGQLVLYLGAIALVERSPVDRWTLPILLTVAFGARLIAVVEPPFLSTDVYRYVWDGMVQTHGINPFRYIPADSHLAFLREGQIYPFINRRDYAHTIYPPGAQAIFLLVARTFSTVPFMKLTMVGFEFGTCFVLMRCLTLLGLARERIVLYAWHPICVWEIASSGHVDAAALTAIALALLARLSGKPLSASGWLGAAALVKLYPAALLPAFARRRVLAPLAVFAGILVGGYLPYLSVGSGVFGFLPAYATEEGLNTGTRYFPLAFFERHAHVSIAPGVYILVCAAVLAGFAAWAWRRGVPATACVRSALVLAVVLNLCFSPHYPWYFLWLLPMLTLWPWRPAFYIVLAVTYMLATRLGMAGEPMYRMNTLLYGGFLLLLLLEALSAFVAHRRRPQQPSVARLRESP